MGGNYTQGEKHQDHLPPTGPYVHAIAAFPTGPAKSEYIVLLHHVLLKFSYKVPQSTGKLGTLGNRSPNLRNRLRTNAQTIAQPE